MKNNKEIIIEIFGWTASIIESLSYVGFIVLWCLGYDFGSILFNCITCTFIVSSGVAYLLIYYLYCKNRRLQPKKEKNNEVIHSDVEDYRELIEQERRKQATEENWKRKVMNLRRHYTKVEADEFVNITQDLIFFRLPISNNDDSYWEKAARYFIAGFVLAQCDDYLVGKLQEDQLNLCDIFKNLQDSLSNMQSLENYLSQDRLHHFPIKSFTENVLITYGNTLNCYLREIISNLSKVN